VARDGGRAAVVRFRVRFGRVIGRSVHLIDRSMDESDAEILESVLTDMYLDAASVPPVVLVAEDASVTPLMLEYLVELRGRPVEIAAPQRGKRRRAVELARTDALSVIHRDSLRRQSDHNVRARALQELGSALALVQPPFRIECFDMSHLQGTNYVGSMVVFEDGLAKKSDYRHFNVKEVLGNDDVGAMEEVVRRRLNYWADEQSATKFRRADLIIVDGGLPQLHAAQKAAATLGLQDQVEFAALAKREELLYRPGSSLPIALERGSESLYLVQRVRDEATDSLSPSIAPNAASPWSPPRSRRRGSGPARRERLLGTFGSLDALRQATLDELEALAWLPGGVARRLYDHLQAPAQPKPTKGATMSEVLWSRDVGGRSLDGVGRLRGHRLVRHRQHAIELIARVGELAISGSREYAGVAFIVGRSGGVQPTTGWGSNASCASSTRTPRSSSWTRRMTYLFTASRATAAVTPSRRPPWPNRSRANVRCCNRFVTARTW